MTEDGPLASFDEVRALLAELPGPDRDAAAAAAARERQLTKPAGALGRLEELAAWLAAWQGRHPPRVERSQTAVFAGNHGVAAQGICFPERFDMLRQTPDRQFAGQHLIITGRTQVVGLLEYGQLIEQTRRGDSPADAQGWHQGF